MTILELMDAVLVNEEIDVEIYDIENEETEWEGKYDGFQPRDSVPEKYWNYEVDTFTFGENGICINY